MTNPFATCGELEANTDLVNVQELFDVRFANASAIITSPRQLGALAAQNIHNECFARIQHSPISREQIIAYWYYAELLYQVPFAINAMENTHQVCAKLYELARRASIDAYGTALGEYDSSARSVCDLMDSLKL